MHKEGWDIVMANSFVDVKGINGVNYLAEWLKAPVL